MATKGWPTSFRCSLLFAVILSMNVFCLANDEDRKDYIVYMGSLPEATYSLSSIHSNMLGQLVMNSDPSSLLIRSYKRSFNGFAAKLTYQEAQKLAGMKQVISVFPNRIYHPQTTRSWDYMGFHENINRNLTGESDVVVGVIDTGIWPESESFGDEGFGPPPKKWKGVCNGGQNFTCNNKLIGARDYTKNDLDPSARDQQGHGTHTASTAAGSIVEHASFYGLAQGTARGAVPSARIAAYKVCSFGNCRAIDLLAAFDDAIADGVDIISISLGLESPAKVNEDSIAIGSFHAMAKGIFTVQSAGNGGPVSGSLTSNAPWVLTVAASSIDRQFIDKVVLGNGKTIVGLSINRFPSNNKDIPLVYGSEVSSTCDPGDARRCLVHCIDNDKVKGKIVLCESLGGISGVYEKGAVGAIVQIDSIYGSIPAIVPLPSTALNTKDFLKVSSYHNSTRKPVGRILKSEVTFTPGVPRTAPFSARGPSLFSPDIMKPDVTAPGVNILAAYPPRASASEATGDSRQPNYSIMSGTSMACPHAAGVAAYIKAIHPDWSPAAIKSAIMTTAWQMNGTNSKDLEFAFGSGHLNPVKAANPGLVYETSKDDYEKLLCSLGYIIGLIERSNRTCNEGSPKIAPKDFNYPSMMAMVSANSSFEIVFNRTVTNVGTANSTYTANLTTNPRLKIQVIPTSLKFGSLKETKNFVVKVGGRNLTNGIESVSLEWSDGTHIVRSPIVVHTVQIG